MARRDSWVKNYEDVDFDVPFNLPTTNEQETMLKSGDPASSSAPEPQHQRPPPPPPKPARNSLVGETEIGMGTGRDDRSRVSRYKLSDPGFLPLVSPSQSQPVVAPISSAATPATAAVQQQPLPPSSPFPSDPAKSTAYTTYPHAHTRTSSSDQLLPSSSPVSSPTFPPTSPPPSHSHTSFHTQQQQVNFPSGTGVNTSGVPMARAPRNASFKGSPLNPSGSGSGSGSSPAASISNGHTPPAPQPATPNPFASPFARPGSRGSISFARLTSDESRALSWAGPAGVAGSATPSSTAGSIPALNSRGSMGSMILYRVALPDPSSPSPGQSLPPSFSSGTAPRGTGAGGRPGTPTPATEEGLLPPPGFSHLRASVYSNSGDSIVSMARDSKYPSALGVGLGINPQFSGMGSGGGLVAYAYDPDEDDSDADDHEPDPLHDLDFPIPPPPYSSKNGKTSERVGKRTSDATSSSIPSSISAGKQKEKAPSEEHRVYAGELYQPYPPHLALLSARHSPSAFATVSWRGFVNLAGVVLLLLALICLFIVYPVVSAFRDDGRGVLIAMNTRINSTGQATSLDFDPEARAVEVWAVEKDRFGRRDTWAVEKDPFGRREEVEDTWAVEKDPFGRREDVEDSWAVEKDAFGRKREMQEQTVLTSSSSPSPPQTANVDPRTPLAAHTLQLDNFNVKLELVASTEFPGSAGPRHTSIGLCADRGWLVEVGFVRWPGSGGTKEIGSSRIRGKGGEEATGKHQRRGKALYWVDASGAARPFDVGDPLPPTMALALASTSRSSGGAGGVRMAINIAIPFSSSSRSDEGAEAAASLEFVRVYAPPSTGPSSTSTTCVAGKTRIFNVDIAVEVEKS